MVLLSTMSRQNAGGLYGAVKNDLVWVLGYNGFYFESALQLLFDAGNLSTASNQEHLYYILINI